MNIMVSGGGRIGFHLARLLSVENNDVTVVDADPARIEHVDHALDVRSIVGNCCSVLLLREAGVGDIDLYVSVTGIDETNLISAATAKGLGAKEVVARVVDPTYIESNILYETILGIDYLLSPNALTALELTKYIETPGMIAAEEFGRGLVQVRQVRVARDPMKPDKTLKDMRMPDSVLVGMISREGVTRIPNGESRIERGDVITLIGRRGHLDDAQRMFQGKPQKSDNVVIMGGGSIGLHLAHMLEKRQRSVKLLDWNQQRCEYLATQLQKTKVVCRDATSRATLEQEHIADADAFVATTHDDERNIMAAVLAKEVGVHRTMAVVHQPDFAPLVGKLGIDHAVTPRASFANRILRLVHQKTGSTTAVLEEGQVEIVEFMIAARASVCGKMLKEIKFPRESLVATIVRGDEVIVPTGVSTLAANDTVIVFVKPDHLEAIWKLLSR